MYLFLRAGELEALEWEDVDLARGIVHIHRGTDRERSESKGTKTGIARRFAIEPAILPVLRAMHSESGGVGQVVPKMPHMRDLAEGRGPRSRDPRCGRNVVRGSKIFSCLT